MAQDDAFGVYLHIPFCSHICPYCDFNTYSGQESLIPRYVNALRQEIGHWASHFPDRVACSVFFGGGTPSLLSPSQVGTIIADCRQGFALAADAEVTLEANPNDLDERLCTALLDAGINRLSIGAQTLDHRGLRVLGRLHGAHDVAQAVAAARAAGFTNLSLDLIYGWPGQTETQWRDDLKRVLAGDIGGSVPDLLSLYSLIVEPGTPMFDAAQRGILQPVDDDHAADMYELAIETLANAGWRHYEISNWCSPVGSPSWHNSLYWRNGEYPGIGAGAHSHVHGRRAMNHLSPQRYIETIESGASPVSNSEIIDVRTAMGETMMLGLRLLDQGVSRDRFLQRHGVSLDEQFGPQLARLASLGLIEDHGDAVMLGHRGMLLANSVCAEFL